MLTKQELTRAMVSLAETLGSSNQRFHENWSTGERFEDFTCSAQLPETAEFHRPPVGGAEGIRRMW